MNKKIQKYNCIKSKTYLNFNNMIKKMKKKQLSLSLKKNIRNSCFIYFKLLFYSYYCKTINIK